MFEPVHSLHRKKQIEKDRKERTQNRISDRVSSPTRTAHDNVSFTDTHRVSMVDALKTVRSSTATLPDGHYLRPENHK